MFLYAEWFFCLGTTNLRKIIRYIKFLTILIWSVTVKEGLLKCVAKVK